jgi:hypothetical protein
LGDAKEDLARAAQTGEAASLGVCTGDASEFSNAVTGEPL